MFIDDALRDLATIGNELPREALQWTLDTWEVTGPCLVDLLKAYASGADRSEQTGQALFLVVHLLGEKAETAAFAPLCQLLLDREAADLVLGDAITTTLRRILISTYDGNAAALKAVIEAPGADEYVREAALLALAYLARTGRVPEAEMRAYLLHLLAEMQPQAEHPIWVGWVLAVAHLGYSDLTEQVEQLLRRGFVSHDAYRLVDFRQDLRRTLDDPERMAGFAYDRIGSFTDTISELGERAGFCGEDQDEGELPEFRLEQPFINPLRGVGRNDPCPCGSGKKYKKCCLVLRQPSIVG